MALKQGKQTVEIATLLRCNLAKDKARFSEIEVLNDHGDSTQNYVCQPTPSMGRRYGADATLAGTDIVVTKGNEVMLALEIEEGNPRPKTVIGDVFSVALAQNVHIKGAKYSLRSASVIVAVRDKPKGKQKAKYERLQRCINQYLMAHSDPRVRRVRIVSCPADCFVKSIERLARLEIGKLIAKPPQAKTVMLARSAVGTR